MDPDQTAPKGAVLSGFIVFAFVISNSGVHSNTVYAADLINRSMTFSGQKNKQDKSEDVSFCKIDHSSNFDEMLGSVCSIDVSEPRPECHSKVT